MSDLAEIEALFFVLVSEVEIVDPLVVRFHLKAPWPDFMTFYGTTATAAGIVVPRKYLTEVFEGPVLTA